MDYTIKPVTDGLTSRLSIRMAQRTHADDRGRAPESKFYLTAGFTPPFDAGRVERLWATLFSHCVDPPN
jgi:hypothetical protein